MFVPAPRSAYDIRGIVGKTLTAEAARHRPRPGSGSCRPRPRPSPSVATAARRPELAGALADGIRAGAWDGGTGLRPPSPTSPPTSWHPLLRLGHQQPQPAGLQRFKMVVAARPCLANTSQTCAMRIIDREPGHRPVPGKLEPGATSCGVRRLKRSSGDEDRPPHEGGDGPRQRRGWRGGAPSAWRRVGAELFCEVWPLSPTTTPTPKPENLADVIRAQRDADLGIAFDGDGDRPGVVTREGENIFPTAC